MGGDIMFEVDGMVHDQIEMLEYIRVLPSSLHSGIAGKRGGSFLSVQHWLNGVKPTTVGHSWADAYGNVAGTASALILNEDKKVHMFPDGGF
jgi:hypothetical protein